jgi:type III pantothenate kinase
MINKTFPLHTLLIDIGNTRIKLGLATIDIQGVRSWYYLGQHDTHASLSELIDFFAVYILELKHTKCAVGVCVAGAEAKQRITQALPHFLAQHMKWLTGQTPLLGLHNHYSTPQTLGADRWLAIYGVLQSIHPIPPTPCILATFGTATTVDVLCWEKSNANIEPNSFNVDIDVSVTNNNFNMFDIAGGYNGYKAIFAGGIILAGLNSSWHTVSRNTAQLPDANTLITTDIANVWAVPNNTQSALLQGAICAQIGAVRVLAAQLTTLQGKPNIYLAGGAVQTLAPYLPHAKVLEYPVLMGLAAY